MSRQHKRVQITDISLFDSINYFIFHSSTEHQLLLLVVLMLTILINVAFILDTSSKLREQLFNISGNMDDISNAVKLANIESQSEIYRNYLTIEVISSQSKVAVRVDDIIILEDSGIEDGRGIHVLVLNQATGAVMAHRVFDTYSPYEDQQLINFLAMISEHRVIIFAIKDEASFHLKSTARELLKSLGCKVCFQLSWRDMWAMVIQKNGVVFGESHSKSGSFNHWASPVRLKVNVTLKSMQGWNCFVEDTEENSRRRSFCNRIEGYGEVCNCTHPLPLSFAENPAKTSDVFNVPIAVIASNRPHYLYETLLSLLSANRVSKRLITVFIDGYFHEPLEVTKLLSIRGIQHTPIGVKNARISQHYKASLTATFALFPDVEYAIVLEEDLRVSPDFLDYFNQTLPLLREDESLFCISAWNDHGYEHSSRDATLLYRVESMPGLGWLLSRKLYKQELEIRWPTAEKQWDWNLWMRLPNIRRNRECIIPDISRTYHIGTTGLNMNPYFHENYFRKHSFNRIANVTLKDVDNLKQDNYEKVIRSLLANGIILDHSKSPCEPNFIPNTVGQVYIAFIKMDDFNDYKTWLRVATCFKIWDLDPRGYHRSLWRFFLKSNHILVVGVPSSQYSSFKPSNITPIHLRDEKMEAN